MDELDPDARDLLHRYRDEVRLAAPARARVGERITASIDAEHDPATAPARPRRVALAAGLLTALAAAVALLVCDVRGRLGAGELAGEAAPYVEQRPATRPITPARGDAPGTGDAPAGATSEVALEPQRPEPPRRVKPELSALAAELDLLRRARAAIDAGDGDAALALLGEHARMFAGGQLQQDRDILRVEALCAEGDATRARAAAAAFLRDHPGSPHAARVRTICADETNVVTDRPGGGQTQHHD